MNDDTTVNDEVMTARELVLSGGRTLAVSTSAAGVDRVELRAINGSVELAFVVGPEGPRLLVRAVDIEIVAERRLSMSCSELDIRARNALRVEAGCLDERVERDVSRIAQGNVTVAGRDVAVLADAGEVVIRANDDLDLRGERIRLNCEPDPLPLSWDEFDDRIVARCRRGTTEGSDG